MDPLQTSLSIEDLTLENAADERAMSKPSASADTALKDPAANPIARQSLSQGPAQTHDPSSVATLRTVISSGVDTPTSSFAYEKAPLEIKMNIIKHYFEGGPDEMSEYYITLRRAGIVTKGGSKPSLSIFLVSKEVYNIATEHRFDRFNGVLWVHSSFNSIKQRATVTGPLELIVPHVTNVRLSRKPNVQLLASLQQQGLFSKLQRMRLFGGNFVNVEDTSIQVNMTIHDLVSGVDDAQVASTFTRFVRAECQRLGWDIFNAGIQQQILIQTDMSTLLPMHYPVEFCQALYPGDILKLTVRIPLNAGTPPSIRSRRFVRSEAWLELVERQELANLPLATWACQDQEVIEHEEDKFAIEAEVYSEMGIMYGWFDD